VELESGDDFSWFLSTDFVEGGKPGGNPENLSEQGENQQQTQHTYGRRPE